MGIGDWGLGYLNDFEFPYEKENGFQIISENIPNFNYKGNTFILKLREKRCRKKIYFYNYI